MAITVKLHWIKPILIEVLVYSRNIDSLIIGKSAIFFYLTSIIKYMYYFKKYEFFIKKNIFQITSNYI